MPNVRKQVQTGRKKTSGVLSRIAPVSLQDSGLKMNIYGRSGTGKTTFAATFPKPLLHITSSSVGLGESRSIAHVKGVYDVELESSAEVEDLVEVAGSGKYKTIVLDHATGLQDLILKEILGIEQLPAQKSWGMASREQYGQCALQMKERLRSLLRLDCNVVIIAQEREFNTEAESDLIMPYVSSALTPSVVGWLNPACDFIVHAFIRPATREQTIKIKGKVSTKMVRGRGVEFCIRTAPHEVYTTKFRTPRGKDLPEVIVDPSYEKIKELVK